MIKLPFKTKEQLADLIIERDEKRENYNLTEPLPEHIKEELKSRPMNKKERRLANKYVLIGFVGWVFCVFFIIGVTFGLFKFCLYLYKLIKDLI